MKSKVVKRLTQGHSAHTGQSLNFSIVSFDLITSAFLSVLLPSISLKRRAVEERDGECVTGSAWLLC